MYSGALIDQVKSFLSLQIVCTSFKRIFSCKSRNRNNTNLKHSLVKGDFSPVLNNDTTVCCPSFTVLTTNEPSDISLSYVLKYLPLSKRLHETIE